MHRTQDTTHAQAHTAYQMCRCAGRQGSRRGLETTSRTDSDAGLHPTRRLRCERSSSATATPGASRSDGAHHCMHSTAVLDAAPTHPFRVQVVARCPRHGLAVLQRARRVCSLDGFNGFFDGRPPFLRLLTRVQIGGAPHESLGRSTATGRAHVGGAGATRCRTKPTWKAFSQNAMPSRTPTAG